MDNQAQVQKFLDKHEIKYPECGFYIGDGWLNVVFAALEQMLDAGWNKDLQQVKSKFCTLRIYIGESDGEIDGIVTAAETKCLTMCEECGKPHGQKVPKTGMAICKDCR